MVAQILLRMALHSSSYQEFPGKVCLLCTGCKEYAEQAAERMLSWMSLAISAADMSAWTWLLRVALKVSQKGSAMALSYPIWVLLGYVISQWQQHAQNPKHYI